MNRKGILCFIKKEDKVLLLDVDFGNGMRVWNGISGYINSDEKMEDAVLRETMEEIGIMLDKSSLVYKGKHVVSDELTLEIFIGNKWSGVPIPREESIKNIQWFEINKLPFHKMFPGNEDWVPNFIK